MNLCRALYLAPLSLAALLLSVPAERAAACAVAPHSGDSVQMADESAIIVWDAASKTQHFIRRATFTAGARDFGFLVPTPTQPELAEAGDDAFATLADLTKPKVVTRSAPTAPAGGGCGCSGGVLRVPGGAGAVAQPAVEVLDAKRVAGYDAVVLRADDAGALGKWLTEHGYESSPALTEWAAPYVKTGWKISAFKIARDGGPAPAGGGGTARGAAKEGAPDPAGAAGQVATSAVRMTFHTEHPFFPYREPPRATPSAAAPPRRLLRVYFLDTGRGRATLGEGGKDWSEATNSARVVWANEVAGPDRERLLGQLKLPEETPPASWWLTEFEDSSTARPGAEDLYFVHDVNQMPVERPPIVQYVSAGLPGCVMCYALALYLLLPAPLRLAARLRRALGRRAPESRG